MTLSGNITVTLGANLVSDASFNIKFIINDSSGNIVTIEGNNKVVNVTASGYTGLVQSASDLTKVQNVGVTTGGSGALVDKAGWVGSQYFRGTIEFCYSTGNIFDGAGGICGQNGATGGTCKLNYCYSTGTIGN